MNYFELHVGDYDAATAHLSMLEDAAYGRMLRLYYRTERPLPPDPKAVYRLVRATSTAERKAVDTVLAEFFELRADGYHQARADAELQRFLADEPERQLRRANEEQRLARHRQERQALFAVLTAHGQHAPWNIKIDDLRRLVAPLQAKPATPPATPPATGTATPATATHGYVPPPPSTQYPEEEIQGGARQSLRDGTPPVLRALVGGNTGSTPPPPPPPAPPFPAENPSPAILACRAIAAAGIADTAPGDQLLHRLLAAGVSTQLLVDTAAELVLRGKGRWKLLLATIEGRLADAAAAGPLASAEQPWHQTRAGIVAKGASLGLGVWTEDDWVAGRMPQWPTYQAKVFAAAGYEGRAA